MNQQNKTERWEEEFDKKVKVYDGWNSQVRQLEWIRSFISQLLSDAKREEREICFNNMKRGCDNLSNLIMTCNDMTEDYLRKRLRFILETLTTAEESIKNLK